MSSKPRNVLLVEDDPTILAEIADFLRRRDYHVVTAADLDAGMQALAHGVPHPDVVVTDVYLPDGEGLELLDYVNSRLPPPPRPRMIVMTGHLDARKADQAREDGAETVLLKPFSLRTLLTQLRDGAQGGTRPEACPAH